MEQSWQRHCRSAISELLQEPFAVVHLCTHHAGVISHLGSLPTIFQIQIQMLLSSSFTSSGTLHYFFLPFSKFFYYTNMVTWYPDDAHWLLLFLGYLYSAQCKWRNGFTVSFRVRFMVRNRVRVRVRLFLPLHHLHFATCIAPNTESPISKCSLVKSIYVELHFVCYNVARIRVMAKNLASGRGFSRSRYLTASFSFIRQTL